MDGEAMSVKSQSRRRLLGPAHTALLAYFGSVGLVSIEPTACLLAVGETVILAATPSTFSRCVNSDGERASAE